MSSPPVVHRSTPWGLPLRPPWSSCGLRCRVVLVQSTVEAFIRLAPMLVVARLLDMNAIGACLLLPEVMRARMEGVIGWGRLFALLSWGGYGVGVGGPPREAPTGTHILCCLVLTTASLTAAPDAPLARGAASTTEGFTPQSSLELPLLTTGSAVEDDIWASVGDPSPVTSTGAAVAEHGSSMWVPGCGAQSTVT